MLDILVHMYQDNSMKTIQRVQTGVRIEKRLLKVLKGLAEYLDMSVGDLLEGVVPEYDGAGVIREVRPGVDHLAVGDHVVLSIGQINGLLIDDYLTVYSSGGC